LTVSEEEAGDATGNVLTVNTVAGALNVGIKGDVNLDGRHTSILDVIKLVRILIGKDAAPVDGSTAFKIADMNSDGNLNIADVIAIVNDILGLPPSKPIMSAPVQFADPIQGLASTALLKTGYFGLLSFPRNRDQV
tara:strand:- start:1819 stop:2226 length:408 start_codon:yes stop_codon:yes gene_type:complete